MQRVSLKHLYAAIFALSLSLLLSGVVYVSSAASEPPGLMILTSQPPATCTMNGLAVPAAMQGEDVSFKLGGYRNAEVVDIDVTFPDGRILGLPAAIALDGPMDTGTANAPITLTADAGGEIYFNYTPNDQWFPGCYMLTAHGLSSGKAATNFLVLMDVTPTVVTAAQLSVSNESGGGDRGPVADVVKVLGDGMLANESISLSLRDPKGLVSSLPVSLNASISGGFETTFTFNAANPPGTYTFTATGKTSGYQATDTFELLAPAVTPTGDAQLKILVMADRLNPQLRRIEIQGTYFTPTEGVKIQVLRPDQSQDRTLNQRANEQGKVAISFTLDQQAPTGVYTVIATGTDSNKVATSTFTFAAPFTPVVTTTVPTTVTITVTAVPPTATAVPPTATAVPPTATAVPPTATAVPPTATAVPPTATAVPPSATAAPPTATAAPPSATAVPPTATAVPPTTTAVPPTATAVPPSATAVPPTATAAPASPTGGAATAAPAATTAAPASPSVIIIVTPPAASATPSGK